MTTYYNAIMILKHTSISKTESLLNLYLIIKILKYLVNKFKLEIMQPSQSAYQEYSKYRLLFILYQILNLITIWEPI
jgi:hypothetical protein